MKRLPVNLAVLAVALGGCGEPESTAPIYDTATVQRASISVSVGSAGIIEPLATVEVKSKASGEVLELMVETGDDVVTGDLLVRIDPRTVRNQLAQVEAELKAARSRRTISETQMKRAESLVKQGTFTAADFEQAALELANAEAQVVSAEVAVENARIAVDDTEIRAPVGGTIIEKPVEKGQVISSPTRDVGGGTLLMKMADLSEVQVRALVDETDIGKVRPGMIARVTVAAYPNQPFSGEVVKIEPQAVVDQNVTMFAVIISIRNPEGLLLPGMNAEVDVSIASVRDVPSLPVMALRTDRDVVSTSAILGVSADELRAQIRATAQTPPDRGDPGPVRETISVMGRTVELPDGVDAGQVRDLMDKRRSGAELAPEERQLLRGLFSDTREDGAAVEADYRFGGTFWVIVRDGTRYRAQAVQTGLTDLDRVQLIAGLDEGETVLILPSANLIETQERLQDFINRRVGTLPGMGSR